MSKSLKTDLTPLQKLTDRQKNELLEDTLDLVKRHGWEPFAIAVEAVCHRVALHEHFGEWIWEKRAEIVSQTRAGLSKKS